MTRACGTPPASIPTGPAPWDSSWPESVGEDERRELLGYLERRFGVEPQRLGGFEILRRGKAWHLLRKGPHLEAARRLKVERVGLRAFHRVGRWIKPTTKLVQLVAPWAHRNKLLLTEQEWRELCERGELRAGEGLEPGYVILVVGPSRVVGLGLWMEGTIRSQVPRAIMRASMHRATGEGGESC